MKKIILTVFAALMALAVFTSCEYKATLPEPTLKDFSNDKAKKLEIQKNETYNNQVVFDFLDATNGYVAKKGDIFTFIIKGKPDGDVSELKTFVVDNSEAANYWKMLSSYKDTGIKLEEGKDVEIRFDIEITENSSGPAPAACKLALYFEPVQEKTVTFTVSSFYMEVK